MVLKVSFCSFNIFHPQSGLRFPGSTTTGAGCVLLVSNMSETETECDHLFILFGVYGDVQVGGKKACCNHQFLILTYFQRVKILFNKKDTALIQMAEPQQAMLAISHLDKCKLWGKVRRTNSSISYQHSNCTTLFQEL